VLLPQGTWYTIKKDDPTSETPGIAGGLKYQDNGTGNRSVMNPPVLTHWTAVYWFWSFPRMSAVATIHVWYRASAGYFDVLGEFEIGPISKAAGVWVGTVTGKVDSALGITWNNITRSTEYDPSVLRTLNSDPEYTSDPIRYTHIVPGATTSNICGLYFSLRPARWGSDVNTTGNDWEHKGELMTCEYVTRLD
jgi:hypothetical protein